MSLRLFLFLSAFCSYAALANGLQWGSTDPNNCLIELVALSAEDANSLATERFIQKEVLAYVNSGAPLKWEITDYRTSKASEKIRAYLDALEKTIRKKHSTPDSLDIDGGFFNNSTQTSAMIMAGSAVPWTSKKLRTELPTRRKFLLSLGALGAGAGIHGMGALQYRNDRAADLEKAVTTFFDFKHRVEAALTETNREPISVSITQEFPTRMDNPPQSIRLDYQLEWNGDTPVLKAESVFKRL